MDREIEELIHAGRRHFRAGDVAVAIAKWKDAMRIAYEQQNHAAAFVLSKNLGDAALEEHWNDSLLASSLLTEAVNYYDYALQLIETCGLKDDVGINEDLESMVRYIRRRRRRARRLLEEEGNCIKHEPLEADRNGDEAQEEDGDAAEGEDSDGDGHDLDEDRGSSMDEGEPPHTARVDAACTTCGGQGSASNPIVIDEADGCPYCQVCFDEYYASVAQVVELPSMEQGSGRFDPGTGDVWTNSDPPQSPHPLHRDSDPASGPGSLVKASIDSKLMEDEVLCGEAEAHAASERESQVQCEEASVQSDRHEPGATEPVPLHSCQPISTLQYSIAQLKHLRQQAFALPCPPQITSSVVSALAKSKSHSTPSHKQSKRVNQRREAVNQVNNDSHDGPPTLLLPTLAECEAMKDALSVSDLSPLTLAEEYFDGDTATSLLPFKEQLKLFAATFTHE